MFTPHFAAPDSAAESSFVSDVQYYLTLTPRQLPSRYFYDALGSALFEAICQLPWYRITRAEQRLLASHGREILSRLQPLTTLVELGPGSGEKLAALVGSGRRRQSPLTVHLVDVSAAALDLAHRTLSELDAVDVVLHEATYETGLREVASGPRNDGRLLTLFLGSNIGNFDRPGANAFLRSIRAALAPGDALLIGADLVKPEAELLLAYDDPLGVTAAFNRNLLVRINRELGADFDLNAFAIARSGTPKPRASRCTWLAVGRQRVSIRRRVRSTLHLKTARSIWTESSYKYRPSGIIHSLEATGFRRVEQWTDAADGFALTLVEAM